MIGPFADFMRRPIWPVILLFVLGYKLGESMAGVMATPLYISLGFSLDEIAAVSKLVGFFATVAGALVGGVITVRFGILRSLMAVGYFSQWAIYSTCCKPSAATGSPIWRSASRPKT